MSVDERHIEPAADGGWIRRLWPFLAVHRRDVFVALGASVIGAVALGIGTIVQKVLVDGAIVHHSRSVAPWLILLLALSFLTFGLAFVRRWFGGRVSLAVQHGLRTAIFDRLMRLDFAGHDRLRTGQLVSRASSDLGLIL